MPKYVLWMKQRSDGCDYSIGCGQVLLSLKSENLEDVYEEVKEKVEYYGAQPGNDNELSFLRVFEVSNTYDLKDDIYGEIIEKEKKRKQEQSRKKDMEELEKLLKKYPDILKRTE